MQIFNSLILDLDGTLVDSFQDIYLALISTAGSLDLPVPSEIFLKNNMHMRLDQLVQVMYPNAETDSIMAIFRNNYDGSGYPNTRPYPTVEETLQFLKNNSVRLFVVTNKRKIAADIILSRFNSGGIIEQIMASDCTIPPLSKDKLVKRILHENDLDPLHTAMIGDTQADLDAALNNGLYFIYAAYGYGTIDLASTSATQVSSIDSFLQLEQLIQSDDN